MIIFNKQLNATLVKLLKAQMPPNAIRQNTQSEPFIGREQAKPGTKVKILSPTKPKIKDYPGRQPCLRR